MGTFTSYLIYFASLFCTDSPRLPFYQEDSLHFREMLQIDTLHLPLSGPSFEVSFYRDGISLLSTMHKGIGWVPMDSLDISMRKALFENDIKPYPPAGITFTRDQQAFFSASFVDVPGFFTLEKIVKMSVDSGTVSGAQPVDFTYDSCRYLDPSLSRNDSLLVFSTDRLPTRGGLDLFVTHRDSGAWSDPVPLDPSINSSGHERYPFLDRSNNLWFSSTGHRSPGDYDIYVSPFNGQDWDPPRDLGSFINTPLDEIGFSIHPNGQVALFTRKSLSEGRAIRIRKIQTAMEHLGMEESTALEISPILQNLSRPPDKQVSEERSEAVSQALVQVETPEQIDTLVEEPEHIGQEPEREDPQKLNFRVQILSSTNANTTPSVVIEGTPYQTYEYFYKGAYRITVGQFESVQDANNFRLQCRRAGFNQAFVAAFRGGKRETDPSVFKE